MAGETIKTHAVCLAIRPWSRTSHVVAWLTSAGVVSTVVKGAVRPKSAFLGQYDLNYSCEILYYERARGDLHALRECSPLDRRDALRGDFRALALTDWFRRLAHDLAPSSPEAAEWLELLENSLGGLEGLGRAGGQPPAAYYLQRLLDYELAVLRLSGLSPELDGTGTGMLLRGEREIRISPEVRNCLKNPRHESDLKILVDSARIIFVYYSFHLDCAPEVRRTVLRMISQ